MKWFKNIFKKIINQRINLWWKIKNTKILNVSVSNEIIEFTLINKKIIKISSIDLIFNNKYLFLEILFDNEYIIIDWEDVYECNYQTIPKNWINIENINNISLPIIVKLNKKSCNNPIIINKSYYIYNWLFYFNSLPDKINFINSNL